MDNLRLVFVTDETGKNLLQSPYQHKPVTEHLKQWMRGQPAVLGRHTYNELEQQDHPIVKDHPSVVLSRSPPEKDEPGSTSPLKSLHVGTEVEYATSLPEGLAYAAAISGHPIYILGGKTTFLHAIQYATEICKIELIGIETDKNRSAVPEFESQFRQQSVPNDMPLSKRLAFKYHRRE